MVALKAGYGMQVIKQDDLRWFIAYGIVSTSPVIAIFAYLPLAAHERCEPETRRRLSEHARRCGCRVHNASAEGTLYQPRDFRVAARPVHEQAHPLPVRARGLAAARGDRTLFPSFSLGVPEPRLLSDAPPGAERSIIVLLADASDNTMPRSLERKGNHYDQARFFCIYLMKRSSFLTSVSASISLINTVSTVNIG